MFNLNGMVKGAFGSRLACVPKDNIIHGYCAAKLGCQSTACFDSVACLDPSADTTVVCIRRQVWCECDNGMTTAGVATDEMTSWYVTTGGGDSASTSSSDSMTDGLTLTQQADFVYTSSQPPPSSTLDGLWESSTALIQDSTEAVDDGSVNYWLAIGLPLLLLVIVVAAAVAGCFGYRYVRNERKNHGVYSPQLEEYKAQQHSLPQYVPPPTNAEGLI